jgi:hypothetical protein
MKGVFVTSFRDYFLEHKSEADWKDILEKSGLGAEKIILHSLSVDDKYVKAIVDGMSEKLGMSVRELLIELGKFFVLNTAARFYRVMLSKYSTFEDFVLNINSIHANVVQNLPGANPPKFGVEYVRNKIIIKYISNRKLIDYAYGALLGAALYYKATDVQIGIPIGNTIEIKL